MANRATRSGTRQNSNEPQVPTPRSGAGAGPGRTPKGKKQKGGERELPALTPNISSAYGGAGRATLAESLRGQKGTANFAQQLEDERAVGEENNEQPQSSPRRSGRNTSARQSRASSVATSEPEETPKRGGRSKKNTPAKANLPPVREERDADEQSSVQDDDDDDDDEDQDLPDRTTFLENNKSYAKADAIAQRVLHQRPISPDEPERIGLGRRLTMFLQQTYVSAKQNRPSGRTSAIIGTLIFALAAILTTLLWHPEPNSIITDLHPIDSAQYYSSIIWQSLPSAPDLGIWRSHKYAGEYPYDLEREVKRIREELKHITEASTIRDATIDELNQMLPDNLVVKEGKNGKFEIPDRFWRALKDKVDVSFGSRDSAPSWDAFLARNKAELKDMLSSEVDHALQSASSAKRIISHEELTTLLRDNYASLSSEIARVNDSLERRYNNILTASTDTAISSTKKTIAEQLKHIPTTQLNTIATANLVKNSELALKNVNFFSLGMGAMVDPFLTSSTLARRAPTTLETLYRKFFSVRPAANPPISALEPWQETGDCWCAAGPDQNEITSHTEEEQDTRKKQPKAQLAVVVPEAILPDKITIEHVPREATLDISVAPRHMELWVSVPDEEQRELVGRAAESYMQSSQHVPSFEPDDTETKGKKSRKNKMARKFYDRALDHTFVRIAQWEYDIHAINHVQTFPVDVPLAELGVGVGKMAIRATSNWGGPNTCLYRVRMHGAIAGAEEGK